MESSFISLVEHRSGTRSRRIPKSFLRHCLFSYNYTTAQYTPDGKMLKPPDARHVVESRINGKRPNTPRGWELDRHLSGDLLVYGYNSPNLSAEYAIVMIDVDFAPDALRDDSVCRIVDRELDFSISWERSPSGNWHGYYIINYKNSNRLALNRHIDRVAKSLDSLRVKYGWVDSVKELTACGKAPSITYGQQGCRVAKQYRLMQLPIDLDSLGKASVVSIDDRADYLEAETRANLSSVVQKSRDCGSTSYCLGADQIDLLDSFRRIVGKVDRVAVSGDCRAICTTEDFAIFLLVVYVLQSIGNADGSMPMAWIEETWRRLEANGLVSRAVSRSRLSAMRRYLGMHGLIEYVDPNYWVGYMDGERYVPGSAAKWKLCDAVITCVEAERDLFPNNMPKFLNAKSLPDDLVVNFMTSELTLRLKEQDVHKIVAAIAA